MPYSTCTVSEITYFCIYAATYVHVHVYARMCASIYIHMYMYIYILKCQYSLLLSVIIEITV